MLQTDNRVKGTEQFAFYKIPKALFTNPQFSGLSVEAKVLYGLMLDRVSLSRHSGWLDEAGRIYIYFSNKDVQEQLGCGHCKASRHLRELETSGLIQRQHQWLGNPDRIYVRDLADCQNAENEASENENAENKQSDDATRDSALHSSTQTAENELEDVSKRENSPVFSVRLSEKPPLAVSKVAPRMSQKQHRIRLNISRLNLVILNPSILISKIMQQRQRCGRIG